MSSRGGGQLCHFKYLISVTLGILLFSPLGPAIAQQAKWADAVDPIAQSLIDKELGPVKHRSAKAQVNRTRIRTRVRLVRARAALEECGKKMFEKRCASSSSNQDDPFVSGRQRQFASRAKTGPTIAISKT